jgi:hypothetical protein
MRRLSSAALFLFAAAIPADDKKADGVKPYVWVEGKCEIKFPSPPMKSKNLLSYATPGAETVYLVTVVENAGFDKFTDDIKKTFFNSFRDGLVKNQKGKLLGEKDVKGEGFAGREVSVETDAGKVYRTRVLIAGDKFYTVTMTGKKDAVTGKDADAFFESFKLAK